MLRCHTFSQNMNIEHFIFDLTSSIVSISRIFNNTISIIICIYMTLINYAPNIISSIKTNNK